MHYPAPGRSDKRRSPPRGGGTMRPGGQAMNPNPAPASHLVAVRPEPAGGFTAQVVGLPELSATAATREEAVRQVQVRLAEWLADGRLVSVPAAGGGPVGTGWVPRDPNDPLEREF